TRNEGPFKKCLFKQSPTSKTVIEQERQDINMGQQMDATTIFAIRHNNQSAMCGDGQVTLGNAVIMKHSAKKVRTLFHGKVVAGFAGSVADAFTLFAMFEGRLEEFDGNLMRAAVELARACPSDKVLRQLEAMLLVMNDTVMLLFSGSGE